MSPSSYRLIAKKGQGGMAEVFKAIKSGPDGFSKTVALKKIIPTHSDQETFIRMLSTEAKIHSYLNHPNIVQLLDFFEEDSQYSMVLEYVDGKNLKEIVSVLKEQSKPLPWQACVFIAMETLKGLSYAHNQKNNDGPLNIIHRDVSPHNILISYQGEVKLSDFGIARAQIARDETASGVLKGKYRYLSPEQILNEELTPASDLFSLGITLYEMLSLQHPFGDQQEYQTFQKILESAHVSLLTLCPDLKPGISYAIDHALRKNPKDRYQHARDFYEDLLKIQDSNWITHGQEELSKLVSQIIPEKLRQDTPIEKTSVLANPILNQHSLLQSSPTIPASKSAFNISPWFYIIPVLAGLIVGIGAVVLKSKNEKPIQEITFEASMSTKDIAPPIALQAPTNNDKKLPDKIIKSFGKLAIQGPAGAHVYINGKRMGDLPLTPLSLSPGRYIVLLDHDQLGQQIKKVAVNSRETVTIFWK